MGGEGSGEGVGWAERRLEREWDEGSGIRGRIEHAYLYYY
jgi:hypothetical protein